MKKRILIPTDFSEKANEAIKTAIYVADQIDAELYFLHSIDVNHGLISREDPKSDKTREEILHKRAAEQLKNQLSNIKELQSVAFTPIIGEGDVIKDIQHYSEYEEIDMIIMGSNGTDGLEEKFIGSTTERIVRYSKVPVMVIKNIAPIIESDSRFVFATSLDPKDKPAFLRAKEVAHIFGLPIELLYINTPKKFKTTSKINKLVDNFLNEEEKKHIGVRVYAENSIKSGIIDFMSNYSDSIFGIGTNGRKGLARFFNGSIAESLVNHSPNSVICFHIN